MTGRKDDGAKPRLDLLFPGFIVGIGRVLTFGAAKYAPENWRKVRHARPRYRAALLRHLFDWWEGKRVDEDSGLHPMLHVGCDAMFLFAFDALGIPDEAVPCDVPDCSYCHPTQK